MKRITHISLVLYMLFAVSCSLDKSKEVLQNQKAMRLALTSNKDYTPHKVEDAIAGDYRYYLKLFSKTDYQVGISSYRDGARSSVEKVSYYSGESPFVYSTRTASQELPQLISSIDGIELNQKSLEPHLPTRGADDNTLDVFGKTVTFRMRTPKVIKTRSGEEETGESGTDEFDMYIPQRISILDPSASSAEENNPLCYYGDFIVRWNADEQNVNGVLVYVEWLGGMAFGNDINETHVKRVAILPDTGEATLNPNLFDGIPDSALCTLVLLRGAIETPQGEEYSYSLIGETHHMISFILIREIEYL